MFLCVCWFSYNISYMRELFMYIALSRTLLVSEGLDMSLCQPLTLPSGTSITGQMELQSRSLSNAQLPNI